MLLSIIGCFQKNSLKIIINIHLDLVYFWLLPFNLDMMNTTWIALKLMVNFDKIVLMEELVNLWKKSYVLWSLQISIFIFLNNFKYFKMIIIWFYFKLFFLNFLEVVLDLYRMFNLGIEIQGIRYPFQLEICNK